MDSQGTTMSIVEIGDDGALHVPASFLTGAQPRTKHKLDVYGDTIILRRADTEMPLWEIADPVERAEAFRRWANQPRPPAPDIALEYLGREYIY
jgi:hypothetical protein